MCKSDIRLIDGKWKLAMFYPFPSLFFFCLTEAQSTISGLQCWNILGISRNLCVQQDRAWRTTPLEGPGLHDKLSNSL